MSHLVSLDELQQKLVDAAQQVTVGGRYVHYKSTDKTYRVTELVIIEATNEVGVLYKSEYAPSLSYVRPLSDWLTKIEREGVSLDRFRFIEK